MTESIYLVIQRQPNGDFSTPKNIPLKSFLMKHLCLIAEFPVAEGINYGMPNS